MKKSSLLYCDEETHRNIKVKAAKQGKKISQLLKETFGNDSEEELNIGKKKWPF